MPKQFNGKGNSFQYLEKNKLIPTTHRAPKLIQDE